MKSPPLSERNQALELLALEQGALTNEQLQQFKQLVRIHHHSLKISVWLGVFMLQNLETAPVRGDWDRCHLSMITRHFEPI